MNACFCLIYWSIWYSVNGSPGYAERPLSSLDLRPVVENGCSSVALVFREDYVVVKAVGAGQGWRLNKERTQGWEGGNAVTNRGACVVWENQPEKMPRNDNELAPSNSSSPPPAKNVSFNGKLLSTHDDCHYSTGRT